MTKNASTSNNTVRLHRVLAAKPDKVYRAFTTADAVARWLPPNGFTCTVHHLDAKVDGTYRMSFTNFTTGKCHAFGHHSDLALQIKRGGGELLAQYFDGTRTGLEQAGQHLDGRGLPCPVWPEESKELSRRNTECDVVDCGKLTEAARQSAGLYGCGFHVGQE